MRSYHRLAFRQWDRVKLFRATRWVYLSYLQSMCLYLCSSVVHMQDTGSFGFFWSFYATPRGELKQIFSIKISRKAKIHQEAFHRIHLAAEMSHEAKCSQEEDKISHSRPNSGLRLPLLADLIISSGLPEDVGCYGDGRRWERIWKKTIKCCKSRKDSYDLKILGLNKGEWFLLPMSLNIAVITTQVNFPNS